MSVKLGNIDIAGTQVLYSTTGNNTDGAMTQAITTTQLNLKANDANVVHKTSDETINGVKTFNNEIHFNSGVFVDAAGGDEGGEIEFAKAPNSSLTGNVRLDVYQNRMRIFGPASDGIIREIINVDIEQNALFIPRSDKTNSAVSTIGINKNQNGYVKLGNGIIIQWIKFNYSTGDKAFTFPTPFTTTNIGMSFMFIDEARNNTPSIKNISTTGGTFHPNGYSSGGNIWLIAVGY